MAKNDLLPSILSKVNNAFQKSQSNYGKFVSSTVDNEGWFRQGKFTPLKQVLDKTAPGGYQGAVQRVKSTPWQQFTPLSMKETAVPAANAVFGKGSAAADVIGYGLRGATSLTPFGGLGTTEISNYFKPGSLPTYSPTTERQKTSERVGRALYGTALTAPLGGSNYALNVGGRMAQGSALGVGMNTISNIASGNKLTENLGESALTGIENSWQLAFTNLAADKVAGKFFKTLTPESMKTGSNLLSNAVGMGSPVAKKIFARNATKIFQRALLESPIENTWFTALNKLNGNEKRKFLEAWIEDLPGTTAGNLLFAGINTGKQGLVDLNKPQIDEVSKSIEKTAKRVFGGSKESQGGYIDFLGNTVDGTGRTNTFNNLVDAYYKPNATPQEKIDSYAEIRRLAKDIFGDRKIKQLTTAENKDPENLIMALSDVINKDITTNRGYQEPFNFRNLLRNKELQRGGMDLTDKTKPFPQSPSIPEVKPALIDKKVDLGFEAKSPEMKLPQVEQPGTKLQTGEPLPSRVSQSQNILPLPQGEVKQQVVRNKTQLKNILKKDPNANVRIELKPKTGEIATLGQVPDRADVAATIPNRVSQFTQDVLGYSSDSPKGGKREAGLWTKTLRGAQEKVSTKVEEGLGSENNLIRNASSTLQNFFRGIGMSPERAKASMELRGEMAAGNDKAFNVMDTLYDSLGNNKKSLEKINAVLDPEISKTKASFKDLSKTEKQAYRIVREGLDLVHDMSYANGHISTELYLKNKGKYTPRLYDVTELPPEVSQFVTQGKKINNNLYKQRKDVDAWKMDNSLNDPVYALGKRLAQVQTNTAVKKYTDFLASNQRFVSDVEKPGFTKLSDSPVYGELSGKYVLNSAAEDLKGFFFSNQAMQGMFRQRTNSQKILR